MSAKDSEGCRLDGFLSFSIQIIMGSFAFASLIIKWRQETPRRAPLIWLFDTLKQGSGLLLQHFTNLLFSIIAGQYLHQNSCAWYMCSHIVGSIVRVFCCWILHSFHLQIVAKYQPRFDRLRSGEYGELVSLFTFFIQLNTWWTIISLV
ncbi:MAG: hypothetical protein EZS28_038327 [Streblomastix strix]|uniref:Uncharacterized protein n=1 Tax=Streblomastix strix TaxID=222440 RepID=A0A5J4U8W8_9EUKA|nr:MAG: hypothetical protein EZS28_038327 [Streblomastix strix]